MRVISYLSYNGNCNEAMEYYKEVFNGEIIFKQTYGESPVECDDEMKNKIMHGALKFEDNMLYMADTMKNCEVEFGNNISLSIEFKDINIMMDIFEKLSDNGTITHPVKDVFWGAKFGALADKFGVLWMLSCELDS